MKRIIAILTAFAVLACTICGSYGGCVVVDAKNCGQSAYQPGESGSTGCPKPCDEGHPCKPGAGRCSVQCCQCIFIVPEFQFEIPPMRPAFETERPNALQDVFEHLFCPSIWRPPAVLA